MRTHHYPSDVTDAQWALIEPHIPGSTGGRPRKTDMRDVVDAILYILRTGCQWRYLPIDFPPKSTVWRYFDRWRHDGTLDLIHDRLRRKVRTMEKPYHPRTSASVDSQSVDTTSGGEQRGRDNFKNVDGRKAPYRGRQHGFAVGRPGHGRRRGRRPGGDQTVRPAGRPAGGQGRADVRRRQVPQLHAVRVGRGERAVGAVHRATSRGVRGLGEAADPVDGGADVGVAGPMPGG